MTPKPPLTQNRWFRVGLYITVWTAIALAEAVSTHVAQMHFDKPVGWDLAFRRSFKEFYAFGVLAIGILWLGRRVRLEPGRVGRWLATHFVGALIFWPSYVCTVAWLEAGEISVQTGQVLTFEYLFRKFFASYFVWNTVMYWTVLMIQTGWHSYERYRQQQVQEAELQQQLVEARLDALRMQLNPHFLFNTLHTVSALIHENPDAAERVVARLSDLLRLSLDKSKEREVPLQQELSFLDLYLEIEQTRFADRLHVERKIEAGLQDALVPYLILQPIVENAIRHGIEQREEKGRLAITAQRRDGVLELTVSDNGDGLPEDTNAPPHEGIGLSNTRSRLRHLYGDNQKLELNRATGGGLEARITIPYRTRTGTA